MGVNIDYGFYNSKSDSIRKYDAAQFGRMFDGVLIDGVFPTVGNRFAVASKSGMNITVDTGRAWFNHTWNYLESKIEFKLESGSQYPRYDAVVLQIGCSDLVRTNKIYIKKGSIVSSDPTPPTLDRIEDTLYEYILAYIYVAAEAASITDDNITNIVGIDDPNSFYTGDMLTPYASVISDNIFGMQYVTLSTDGWTEMTGMNGTYYKEVAVSNIAANAIYSLSIFHEGFDSTVCMEEDAAFSFIFKSAYNDNTKKMTFYAYNVPEREIKIRISGYGVSGG